MGLKPWDWDGLGDVSICQYYTKLAEQSGCDYYKKAEQTCLGKNSLVNRVIDIGIADAWARGKTDKSESELLTQIRSGLISHDRTYRTINNTGNSPPRGDIIDLYHNEVFSEVGISSFWYGGNLWPQSIWPNYVPYDPKDNFKYDPRSIFEEEQCSCGD